MPVRGNSADGADDSTIWKDGQETQPNQGGCPQPTGGKILIGRGEYFVKTDYFLMDLCADAADKQIAKWRHFAQNDRWPIFDLSICLGNRRQNDITFGHS